MSVCTFLRRFTARAVDVAAAQPPVALREPPGTRADEPGPEASDLWESRADLNKRPFRRHSREREAVRLGPTVPIANLKLHENMGFACPPSIPATGAQRA